MVDVSGLSQKRVEMSQLCLSYGMAKRALPDCSQHASSRFVVLIGRLSLLTARAPLVYVIMNLQRF